MLKIASFVLLLFLFSCADPAKEKAASEHTESNPALTDTLQGSVSSNSYAAKPALPEVEEPIIKPKAEQLKSPVGVYKVVFPLEDSMKVEQTVKFYNNKTYQLQERYPGHKKDSMVVIQGTFLPSNGFIWLYQEQVARGRYKWKGDTLQYFDPLYKKSYSMVKLQDVLERDVWQQKKAQGYTLYGVGNEPFWSIELNNDDTMSFRLADWDQPLKMKRKETLTAKDTTVYLAQNDSSQIKLMVLPYFCSDGMSDFTYQNKILVKYNNQIYSGCGVVYK
jgi:uncharacterized membrane protein